MDSGLRAKTATTVESDTLKSHADLSEIGFRGKLYYRCRRTARTWYGFLFRLNPLNPKLLRAFVDQHSITLALRCIEIPTST